MQQFKIRRNFLLALGLTSVLLVVLLVTCIYQQETKGKIFILAALMLPVLALLAESLKRRVVFSGSEIIAYRLLRQKRLSLADVTSVDTVRVRRRAFVSISTEEDFLILSNNYERFDQLLRCINDQLPEAVISEETRALKNDPPRKSNDLFSIWLAVIVLLLVLYMQLGGTF